MEFKIFNANTTDVVLDSKELGQPTVYDLIGDMWAIDKIATLLGTSDDWSGADYLDMIAEIVGIVRPHPAGDGHAYATTFHRKTNRNIFPDFDQRR